jgi:ubiquinone biosynthesis protein UbiJ
MREVVFRFVVERPGHLEARSDVPALHIAAPTLEELQHEAREALIEHFGPVHCAYRVRILRCQPQQLQQSQQSQQLQKSQRVSGIRPLRRLPALCS